MVTVLWASSAYADPGPFPGRAEFEALFECVHREALKQDDGRADIYSVAAKVAAICHLTYEKLAAVDKRHKYPPPEMNNFDFALEAVHANRVINYRAAHSNQDSPQNKIGH